MMNRAALNTALLAAHDLGDAARLVTLYTLAANAREASGDVDAACFFLTQAYVFALEVGAAETDALNRRLVAHGREVRYRF